MATDLHAWTQTAEHAQLIAQMKSELISSH